MEVNKARLIDYWLGIPLCGVLSVFEKVTSLFLHKKKNISPRKIMFIGLSEMGSVILAYPAMRKTQELYPEAELFFLIFKENEDVLHVLKTIPQKNVFTLKNTDVGTLCKNILSLIFELRKKNIDTVIDIELFSRFSSILSYLSGAKMRSGFHKYTMEGLFRGSLHTHKVIFNPYFHISINFIALIESLRADVGQMPLLKKALKNYNVTLPELLSDEREKEHIRQKLAKENSCFCRQHAVVVINPDLKTRLPLRRWPSQNYTELAKKLLLSRNDIFIVIVGVGYEGVSFNFSHERCANMIGKTSLVELIGIFNVAAIVISHDSGILHLASLTSVGIIGFFGPETPVLYAPLNENKTIIFNELSCSPCFSAFNHRTSICRDNKCINSISVEEVYALALKKLSDK